MIQIAAIDFVFRKNHELINHRFRNWPCITPAFINFNPVGELVLLSVISVMLPPGEIR